MVEITFPATGKEEPVNSIDLTAYIGKPATGGGPGTSFYAGTCFGTVEWKADGSPMPGGVFLMGTVYTAEVTLKPMAGYVFPGEVDVTHALAASSVVTTRTDDEVTVSITFSRTGNELALASRGNVSTMRSGVSGYYYEAPAFTAAGSDRNGKDEALFPALSKSHQENGVV